MPSFAVNHYISFKNHRSLGSIFPLIHFWLCFRSCIYAARETFLSLFSPVIFQLFCLFSFFKYSSLCHFSVFIYSALCSAEETVHLLKLFQPSYFSASLPKHAYIVSSQRKQATKLLMEQLCQQMVCMNKPRHQHATK